MQKPPAANFSSQNAFAALETKRTKKKKASKDKDDKGKKDKTKSGGTQNGVAGASSTSASAYNASAGPVNWADSDSDDGFDVPMASWVQVWERFERITLICGGLWFCGMHARHVYAAWAGGRSIERLI
jgi:hypothetical protein